VIEDDIFADLELHAAPRLAALDGLSRVIYIGSFSKPYQAQFERDILRVKLSGLKI
jgi:aspartate/methionine/tyrosine aminotransferase